MVCFSSYSLLDAMIASGCIPFIQRFGLKQECPLHPLLILHALPQHIRCVRRLFRRLGFFLRLFPDRFLLRFIFLLCRLFRCLAEQIQPPLGHIKHEQQHRQTQQDRAQVRPFPGGGIRERQQPLRGFADCAAAFGRQFFQRARILPPQSLMGEATQSAIDALINGTELDQKYRQSYDRESAYEIISKATVELEAQRAKEAEEEAARKAAEKEAAAAEKAAAKEKAAAEKAAAKEAAAAAKAAQKEADKKKKVAQQAISNAASSVVSSVSTNIVNAATGGKTTSATTIAKRAARNALSSVMRSGSSAIIRGLFGIKKG